MDILRLSRARFLNTIGWAVFVSMLVVTVAAGLAKATLNINGALINKPEIAIYLLMPDAGITKVETLREEELVRDYLVYTKDGSMLVKMRRGNREWYIADTEHLH